MEVLPTEVENNWMTLLKQYIINGLLLDDSVMDRKVRKSAARYIIVGVISIVPWEIGLS